jgi:hypothetical protein
MAKRKKSKSRRRVGATGTMSANSPVVKFGSLAGGYLLSDKIQEQIDKITGSMDSKIVNGALAAVGFYYLFFFKGKKNLALSAVLGLAAGAAAKGLLVDFGVLNGFMNVPTVGNFRNTPVINGGYTVPAPMLNGIGNGYTVPASSVMGAVPDTASGSGINPTDR